MLAVGFLFCQAMILQAAKGIPAWRANWVVPLILTTGFAEGCGLLLAAVAQLPALTPLADDARCGRRGAGAAARGGLADLSGRA